MKIFLKKNPNRTDENKQPYFWLKLIPEEANADWIDLGALWKASTGNGYIGNLREGIEVILPPATEVPKKPMRSPEASADMVGD